MHFKNNRLLYSATIRAFLAKVEKLSKEILSKEVGLTLKGSRVVFKSYSYKLCYVVFEDERVLGYFSSNHLEIGIHKLFLFSKDQTALLNLLRHELAHFLTWLEHGLEAADHGKQYHEICRRFGWGKEIYSAEAELSSQTLTVGGAEQAKKILAKVHKLLTLAASSNPHEANLATMKANELLLNHNLSLAAVTDDSSSQESAIIRILPSLRASAKLFSIAQIIRTFFVYPIISKGRELTYLELFGTKENIEIAAYVADFLDRKLEELWEETTLKNPTLKGMTAKNSFFRGIAEGYLNQIKAAEKERPQLVKNALVHLESALLKETKLAYPHLRQTKMRYTHCATASRLGKEKGATLQIHRPLTTALRNLFLTKK